MYVKKKDDSAWTMFFIKDIDGASGEIQLNPVNQNSGLIEKDQVESVLLQPFLKEWQAVASTHKIKILDYKHALHSAEYSDKMMDGVIISGLADLVEANEAEKDKTRIFTSPSKKVIVLEDVKAGKLVLCPASSHIGEPKGNSAIASASP
jgi:hypothetical protein